MLHDVFFEFADAASGVGDARMLGLEEIEEGMRYRLFVTTADGLYRYDMNDIVEVAGRIGETPALAFVQKGRGVTNITGEKLYESQVSEALSAACSESGVRPVFYLALADETTSSYRVYVELEGEARPAQAMSHGLDRALAARNLEYRDKRASGRLRAPRAIMLKPGAALAYRRHCVASGQRESQFKLMPLRYAREVDFDFAPWSVVP